MTRWLTAGVALAAAAASGVALLVALLFAGLTCDESCDDRSSRWRDQPDAWQWAVQPLLPAIALVACIGATVFAVKRRYTTAWAFLAGAFAASLVWLTVFFSAF